MEEKKQRGGARSNAGRKPIVDEKKVNELFSSALKELYNASNDEEAKIRFIKETLMDSQRGQLFIAEHLFGKPKETIETTHSLNNFDIKEIFKIDKD
tara:strand:+ start:156 stop:446 length:291 start_codon:yes stop_codon:yes gene_type:complete